MIWENSWKRPGMGVIGDHFESYPHLDNEFCEVCMQSPSRCKVGIATDFGTQVCEVCSHDIVELNRKKW